MKTYITFYDYQTGISVTEIERRKKEVGENYVFEDTYTYPVTHGGGMREAIIFRHKDTTKYIKDSGYGFPVRCFAFSKEEAETNLNEQIAAI
jgi:hypothetical protein